LPDQWKGSVIVPIHKKGGETDRGISLLSTSHKILSNNLLSNLSPYTHIDEIIGDHQCGFRCNRSTNDQIFCIHQILVKKWEYNETVHWLFVDFRKDYDSVTREVLYKILRVLCTIKLLRLIKVCLNETYSNVCMGKRLSDNFPIQNDVKQGDALLPLIFDFALEYSFRKV
jgi:hypothetical protein